MAISKSKTEREWGSIIESDSVSGQPARAVVNPDGSNIGGETTAANTARTATTEVLPVQHIDAAGVVGGVRPSAYATDDSAMPATPALLPVGGEYRATPTTYADGDAVVDQYDQYGNKKITKATQDVRTQDTMSVAHATDAIMNGTTELTPKFAVIDTAASPDTTLLAAVSGKKIRVLALHLTASGGANTVRFESGTGGTALTGQKSMAANAELVLPFCPVGWFETAAATLLNIELSAATSVDGGFTYVEV